MGSFLRKHWDKLLLFYFVSSYILIFSTLSILRHSSFSSGLDLGNMDQTVWNTLHGRFFSLTSDGVNVSRLAVHSDFLLVLFAPLYALWASPNVLLITQSVYLGLGAIPTFLIAKHLFKNKVIALGFALIYLLSPLVEWVNIFDFHMVSLVIPTFLYAFYCVLTKRWKGYWVFIVLMLLTKEQVGLTIFLLGFVTAVFFKEKKVGVITSLIGVTWFSLMTFVVMPRFSTGGEHWALAWYQSKGPGEIINKVLLSQEVQRYYMLLLKSFGLLPLFGLPWLMLAGPELAINVLSSHSEMQSIQYHYTSVLIPILMIASMYGARYVSILFKKYSQMSLYVLVLGALLIVLRMNYHYSPLPTTESCWCNGYIVAEVDKKFEKILQQIPATASVTSSSEIHAHVSQRESSYLLPYATESANFIALIDQNRIIDNAGPKPYEIELIKKLDTEGRYRLTDRVGHFYLYKKK